MMLNDEDCSSSDLIKLFRDTPITKVISNVADDSVEIILDDKNTRVLACLTGPTSSTNNYSRTNLGAYIECSVSGLSKCHEQEQLLIEGNLIKLATATIDHQSHQQTIVLITIFVMYYNDLNTLIQVCNKALIDLIKKM